MRRNYGKKLVLFVVILVIFSGFSLNSYAEEYSSLKNFQDVLYLIKNYYVEDVEINKLVEGAINGMVEELDPFSSYMTPDEYDEMQLEFDGHFGGIGIVITVRNKKLTIVSPIKGTPGERVGLKSEDIITAIDGKPTANMSQNKAVDMMRGEEGTKVVLTIKRKDEEKPLEFTITRADIEIPYVESEMKTDNIGYVIISQFARDVGIKVDKALIELKSQGARAIILDLRNNPGGMLTEAIKVASNFIEKGVVVSVKQREGNKKEFNVNNKIEAVKLPMVILINRGSASASEIVAGAIKDYNRGKLVGSKTFGKGTVQTVIPLKDGSALRLTTARYYTPGGNFIHEKGIKPDIEIKFDPEYDGDNQLDKAIELLNSYIDTEGKRQKPAG